MREFDIVFEKLAVVLTAGDAAIGGDQPETLGQGELDEIEELRRYSAEILEPEPSSYTIT